MQKTKNARAARPQRAQRAIRRRRRVCHDGAQRRRRRQPLVRLEKAILESASFCRPRRIRVDFGSKADRFVENRSILSRFIFL